MPLQTSLVPLCELAPNQEADFFALLAAKEELKTRDNKPYHKVTFSDRRRAVTTPIWSDSAWAADLHADLSSLTDEELQELVEFVDDEDQLNEDDEYKSQGE